MNVYEQVIKVNQAIHNQKVATIFNIRISKAFKDGR